MKDFINKKVNYSNNNKFHKGKYYIISGSACFPTKKQVESCISIVRLYLKRYKKKRNFVNLVNLNIPVTRKPQGARLGAGKGKIRGYIAKVNMNGISFILRNVKHLRALNVYRQMKSRLPMKIYLFKR